MRKVCIVLVCMALQSAAKAQSFPEKWPWINNGIRASSTNFVVLGVETGSLGRVIYQGNNTWGIWFPVGGYITNTIIQTYSNDTLNVDGGFLGLNGSPTGLNRVITLYEADLVAKGILTDDYFPVESWPWAPGLGFDVRIKGYSTGLKIRNYADDDWRDIQCRDLFVYGTQTIANVTALNVGTNKITLNAGWSGAPMLDAWLGVNRGTEPEARLRFNEATDRWEFGTTNAMRDLEQVFLNATSWTNWVYTNTIPARLSVLEGGTQKWNQAGTDAADWTNWWAGNSDAWASLTNGAFTNIVQSYGTNDNMTFTGQTIYVVFNTNVSSGGGGDIYSASNNVFTGSTNTFEGSVRASRLTPVSGGITNSGFYYTLGGETFYDSSYYGYNWGISRAGAGIQGMDYYANSSEFRETSRMVSGIRRDHFGVPYYRMHSGKVAFGDVGSAVFVPAVELMVYGSATITNSLIVSNNATIGGDVFVTGQVSCADPTSDSNVVTKAYGDANYLGGGGSVTQYSFHVAITNSSLFSVGAYTLASYNHVISQQGTGFNTASNGYFTPIAGYWNINVGVKPVNGNRLLSPVLYTNGAPCIAGGQYASFGQATYVYSETSPLNISGLYLPNNCLVQVYVYNNYTASEYAIADVTNSWFTGVLIK